MHAPSNRSVVVIAALLTLLGLGVTTIGLALHRGWLRTASDSPQSDSVSVRAEPSEPGTSIAPAPIAATPSAAPTSSARQDEVAAYRQKLEEAYRALDEAYAEIRALRTAESQIAARREEEDNLTDRDDHDEHHERRSRRSDDDQ